MSIKSKYKELFYKFCMLVSEIDELKKELVESESKMIQNPRIRSIFEIRDKCEKALSD